MPGAGFKVKAREWSAVITSCADDPFNFVKEQLVRLSLDSESSVLIGVQKEGSENVSAVASALRELDVRKDNNAEEKILKNVSAIVYSGMLRPRDLIQLLNQLRYYSWSGHGE